MELQIAKENLIELRVPKFTYEIFLSTMDYFFFYDINKNIYINYKNRYFIYLIVISIYTICISIKNCFHKTDQTTALFG